MCDRVKILIVDNCKDFADVLCCCFENQEDFYVAGVCYDGVDALEKINIYEPDVVVLDIIMPVMSGLDVLREISLSSVSKKPVFIIASAFGKEEVIEKALALGAVSYFIKPFDINMLISYIRNSIS